MKSGISVAMVCRITPKQKTTIVTMRPYLLPKKSAVGAAVRAPKKVPADCDIVSYVHICEVSCLNIAV